MASEVPKMEYRHLGNSGLKVSVLSLGGWLTYGGSVQEEAALECMRVAYENGVNFFDNAEAYASGKSEELFGKAFQKFGWDRSTYIVSTKIFWGGEGVNQRGLSRKHIIEGTNAALKRLGLDYVDLIFAHRPDTSTPMEEVVRAFNWVIDQGKAFYWGTSEWSAEQITDAHRIAEKLGLIGPLMEQPQYHMFHRERFEVEYAPLYQKYGLGTTIWSPLASGILTGKYSKGVPEDSRLNLQTEMGKYLRNEYLESEKGRQNIQKAISLEPIAKKIGASLSQLAIAWCIKNSNVSTVIMGASKFVPLLTDEIIAEIEAVLDNKPKPTPNLR
ncbi:NADP-dependent oxidoreductase domain-containing protein [Polychytrium aggregatum]|uniref:NADP-dependent oxidoreductase domain-containing protein n=1 Tax=Polychytrium aggregatum TaxID=110093 RepID=UPI0022FDB948|nr:NADP-dependent oxidoreductase domain-containing protein [Polychytrium aggregatum]KAI9208320.1 NADP-dependent oxidoreductase domain-containing protein [Polychytrium aggregatum]